MLSVYAMKKGTLFSGLVYTNGSYPEKKMVNLAQCHSQSHFLLIDLIFNAARRLHVCSLLQAPA